MRKLSYLLLTLLTWYLAGMYRSVPLTALFLTETVLFILLLLQTIFFRLTLDADFPTGWNAGEKGMECPCRLRMRNRGFLPAGRVRLTLRLSWPDGKDRIIRNIFAGVEPRRDTNMEFSVLPSYCGPVKVELRQIRVYDYLALFTLARRREARMYVAIFPAARPLRIQRANAPYNWNDAAAGNRVIPRDGASPEIRGLREYRPGDPARRIHWKQSARTGQIWLREYEQEMQGRVALTLKLPDKPSVSAQTWDAFYEILSALTLGLLEHAAAVEVRWHEGKMECRQDVTGDAERRELLTRLYERQARMGKAGFVWNRGTNQSDVIGERTPSNFGADRVSHSGAEPYVPAERFSLDMDLCWRRDNVLIHRFSPENFADEISRNLFAI